MYELRPTTKYRRDVRRLNNRGNDLELLMAAQDLLIQTGTLPDHPYKPHPLRGDYVNCIDAHIAPDWILIYELVDEGVIVLRRTGTHSDLFR
ncbi:MAG: type II toxin-antitoxin system mRNA interferase toxin, RelE/StbE family [Hyphomicrobiales bacterium]|nr:MAG: type II toxin-antitoxin system mRNA interferase toxin, RelE/StbE family [Hyphomicrobiales bacterium]